MTRFEDEHRKSHTVISYVDVVSPSGETTSLTSIDGNIEVDSTAKIRRSCTTSCIDPLGVLTPTDARSLLTPFGTEIRPYRGIVYTDETTEVFPLGVFRISSVKVSDNATKGVRISIEAYDRSRTIQRDKFVSPYIIPVGTNILAAIQQIVERSFPEVEYDITTSAMETTTALMFDVGDDPWDVITQLATSLGCTAYFDVVGRFTVAPDHDPNVIPKDTFEYVEGEDCTMTSLEVQYDDEPGGNGVVVEAESVGDNEEPIRVVVWDDDPDSPTYRYGPYGEVPLFYKDSVVTTEAEAEIVARHLLSGLLTSSATLTARALVNPSLEAGRIVKVIRPASKVKGIYSVRSFSVPLSAKTLQDLELSQVRRLE